jgi:hypothetical protein
VKRKGLLIICPETAEECMKSGAIFTRENIRATRELATHFFGRAGTPQRFVFIMQPPED